MIETLYLHRAHWIKMQHHVSKESPLEACGLLAGAGNRVEEVLSLINAAHSPVRFRIKPQAQYDAFHWMEANGLDLVGIYHSHPDGPDTVSVSDIAESAYPVVNIVWTQNRGIWDAKGYWIEGERVKSVSVQIVGT